VHRQKGVDVRIQLLGGLGVKSGDGLSVRFSTRKTALLFAALVLAGPKGARRESLAEASWP
jgi:DNA-binding SARP family transcriptional activator